MPERIDRQGPGRRQSDEDCVIHEARLDEMERKESKRSGWFTAMASVVSVVLVIGIPVVGWIGNRLVDKVYSIESKLSTGNEIQIKHTEQIYNLDKRVCVIEERHVQDQTILYRTKR